MRNLKRIIYSPTCEYRSNKTFAPIHFFIDALSESISFDLLLGYFSSSALNALSIGFTPFIINGGVMRMIINDVLSADDKSAIIRGQTDDKLKETELDLIVDDFKKLSTPGKHTLNCLAWLIANNRLDIKVVRPRNTSGIMHPKSGIFYDGKNKIAFKGSCNFTAQGILGNIEEINVKQEWNSKVDADAIIENQEYFDNIFSEKEDSLTYLSVEEVKERILSGSAEKSLDELIEDEKKLLEAFKKDINRDEHLDKRYNQLEESLTKYQSAPRFPYVQGPRDYQKEAYKAWCRNNKQGVFAMATGTGKTITALNCLLQEYRETGAYQALILVPTKSLVSQWEKECRSFNFINSIKVCSGEDWEPELSRLSLYRKLDPTHSFLIITTYRSFTSKRFDTYRSLLKEDDLLIADEAHNIGSPQFLRFLPKINIAKRIALSATFHRQYDEEGNVKINKFFNDKPPYTFSYDMEMAIEKGVLCEYDYFPHIVYLTEDELMQYREITEKLLKFFDSDTGTLKKDPVVEMLLLKRKRIIHKAENKKIIFHKIIKEEYARRNSLKYSLIYVPEGESESDDDDDESMNLLNQYTKITSGIDRNIIVRQFTSKTKDREQILKDFSQGKIDVLTSMKCLDEGVDVPRTELAFFCASTGNPKQFIQRRGRVLRSHPDKFFATIHDLVVIPYNIHDNDYECPMQKSLVQNELERVVNFSFLARNKYHTFNVLNDVCNHFGLNLFTINENIKDK